MKIPNVSRIHFVTIILLYVGTVYYRNMFRLDITNLYSYNMQLKKKSCKMRFNINNS